MQPALQAHPPTLLTEHAYDLIASTMLGTTDHPARDLNEKSFTDLMRLSLNNGSSIIGLTEYSAVPVADAVRGFYETVDLPCPTLLVIRANSRISLQEGWGSIIRYRVATSREAHRLRPVIRDTTVTIIDQATISGRTIGMAVDIANKACATNVVWSDRVQWYQQAEPTEIDTRLLTSNHRRFMTNIGRQAARDFLDST